MAERFYVNCPLEPGPLELHGPEAHHLATVCRARPGQHVYLFNGDGRQYRAEITAVAKRSLAVEIQQIERPKRELPFRLEVAAPLPKGDRADFLVEKLTELGVTSFVPLQTRRSVVHPREAKRERLQRQVIEASKQCGRNVLMEVQSLTSWESYHRSGDLPQLRLLAHPGGEGGTWPRGQDVALAVGPEGGFTDEEVEQAAANGWQSIGLGPRILRVETAAMIMAGLAALPSQ